MKFRPGCIVERIRNEDSPAHQLPLGRRYVVQEDDGYGIIKLAAERGTWFHKNFRLVAEISDAPLPPATRRALPTDSEQRKRYPMFSGLLAYFPAALAEVSNHSYEGNEKHNPGLPLQHARGKSGDHEDCIIRHLVDAKEENRTIELRAAAWRVLALLQEHLESEGAPPAPAATFNHKDA